MAGPAPREAPDPDSFASGRVDGDTLDLTPIDDDIARPMPSSRRRWVTPPHSWNRSIATGVTGAVAGALAGAGYVPAGSLDRGPAADEVCHKSLM